MRKTLTNPDIRGHVIVAGIGALLLTLALVFLAGVAAFHAFWSTIA
jgi:hypothetical protein